MVDGNLTIPVLQPIIDWLQILIKYIELLVGGLFGLYLIWVLWRWRELNMIRQSLKNIDKRIATIEKKFKLETQPYKPFLRREIGKIREEIKRKKADKKKWKSSRRK